MNLSLFTVYVLPALIISIIMFWIHRIRAYEKIHQFIEPFVGEKKDKQEYYEREVKNKVTLFCFKVERFAQEKIDVRPEYSKYTQPYKHLILTAKKVRHGCIRDIPNGLPSLLSIFPAKRIIDDDELQTLFNEWIEHESLIRAYRTVFTFSIL